MQLALAPQQCLFRTLEGRMSGLGKLCDIDERKFSIAPQKIDGRVGGDARKPMPGLIKVLQLRFALQRLDEGLLGEILRVVHVAYDAVNQQKDAPQILLDKAGLRVRIRLRAP